MRRDDLVQLVVEIMEARGTEEEIDRALDRLRAQVPDPNVSDLIYWSDPPLSPEQVVEAALAYRPISL
ncbi:MULTISPECIES: bacteriocin immunity protein [unclassified Streptomyces]|uniref:bacteriocin immunity protein n=1 Tax=unclassified Streptomyces TaxID=2593676 RepID=UPI0011E6D364|nr:bacteriocin immunity protein [Streptomyces sp. sk2.1]TXS67513.1 hypothetical protein EAO76_32375 [Streptomyces sp. sk2.1]